MKITNFIIIMIFSIPCYSKIEVHMEMNGYGDLLVRIFDNGVCSEKILKDVSIAYLAKEYRLKEKRIELGFSYLPTSFHMVLFKKIGGSYHWFNMFRLEHQRWTLKPNDEIVRVNNIGPARSEDVNYYYLERLKSATWKGEDSPFQDIQNYLAVNVKVNDGIRIKYVKALKTWNRVLLPPPPLPPLSQLPLFPLPLPLPLPLPSPPPPLPLPVKDQKQSDSDWGVWNG